MPTFSSVYAVQPDFDPSMCENFLNKHGWEMMSAVGQDMSTRRYFRVQKNGRTAILMETVRDDSGRASPGHRLADFLRIGSWLREIGLNAPEIYECDYEAGYVLLEDFGDLNFKSRILAGDDAAQLYGLATHVLDHLAAQDCPLDLPNYYESHVHQRHQRIVDFYVPVARETQNPDDALLQYHYAWKQIEQAVPAADTGFIHVDFHAENLMWCEGQVGLKRCGILDFQGAMMGPRAYDVANLLYDARLDIPDQVRAELLGRYDETTRLWVTILATQFHCRVLGQFIKMAVKDGNDRYLKHIPRLQSYLAKAMQEPLLQPLTVFFDELGVDFAAQKDLNIDQAKAFIAADAA